MHMYTHSNISYPRCALKRIMTAYIIQQLLDWKYYIQYHSGSSMKCTENVWRDDSYSYVLTWVNIDVAHTSQSQFLSGKILGNCFVEIGVYSRLGFIS